MDKILKYIPFTAAIILYLYCCGSLYLIGYWGIFDIDITGFISITEVPKYFVLPFFLSNVFFLVLLVFLLMLFRLNHISENAEKTINLRKWQQYLYLFMSTDTQFVLGVIGAYLSYDANKFSPAYWLSFSSLIVISSSSELAKSNFFKTLIDKSVWRLYISVALIGTLVFSFITGKIKSLSVYKNQSIKYVNIVTSNTNNDSKNKKCITSFKLLGLFDDKAIISSLNNDSIIIVNQSLYEDMVLKSFK